MFSWPLFRFQIMYMAQTVEAGPADGCSKPLASLPPPPGLLDAISEPQVGARREPTVLGGNAFAPRFLASSAFGISPNPCRATRVTVVS